MKKRSTKFFCCILSCVMMLLTSNPAFAVDNLTVETGDHVCSEHMHTDIESEETEITPRGLDPRCWAGNHDFSGEINFYDYHIIHQWNNTNVCKIFYFYNISCSRLLCSNTKDIFYDEGEISCSLH